MENSLVNFGITNRFFGVPAIDLKHYPINAHFAEASDFIDSVIKGKGCILLPPEDVFVPMAKHLIS